MHTLVNRVTGFALRSLRPIFADNVVRALSASVLLNNRRQSDCTCLGSDNFRFFTAADYFRATSNMMATIVNALSRYHSGLDGLSCHFNAGYKWALGWNHGRNHITCHPQTMQVGRQQTGNRRKGFFWRNRVGIQRALVTTSSPIRWHRSTWPRPVSPRWQGRRRFWLIGITFSYNHKHMSVLTNVIK